MFHRSPPPLGDGVVHGRVATLSGQDISGVSKRLTHCTIEAWRPDKGIADCEVLDEEELAKLIL